MEGLGINLGYLLVQFLNFAILMVVINHWVVKPVLGLLEKRRETIARGLEDAREADEARARAEEEAGKIINEAQAKASDIIREATEQAESVASDIKTNVKAEIVATREEKMTEIEEERNRMLQDLRSQVASLAIAAAQKLIGESLDDSRQQALLDEFFSGVKEGRAVVLVDLVLEGASVEVTSALPLSEKEQEAIKKEAFATVDAQGKDLEIAFKVDPGILGGLVIRAGDQVVDGSIAGQLQSLHQSL